MTYALSSVFPFARECGRVTKLRPTGCIEKFCTVCDEQERILKKRDLILLSVSFLPPGWNSDGMAGIEQSPWAMKWLAEDT